jgi:hypothetical protein
MSTKRQVTDALRAIESAKAELRNAQTSSCLEPHAQRALAKLAEAEDNLRRAIPKIKE